MGIYTSLSNSGYWASHDKHLASNARGDELDPIYIGKCDVSLVTPQVNCPFVFLLTTEFPTILTRISPDGIKMSMSKSG
jgi:hypothetical protein